MQDKERKEGWKEGKKEGRMKEREGRVKVGKKEKVMEGEGERWRV